MVLPSQELELLQLVRVPRAQSLSPGLFMHAATLYAPDWSTHRVHNHARRALRRASCAAAVAASRLRYLSY